MTFAQAWHILAENWLLAVVMAIGSFVAGASSEGGGAVAFPVMTLVLDIPPAIARNFSLGIQSVGMTAAAYFVLRQKIPTESRYLMIAGITGAIGMVVGTFFLVPIVPVAHTKMLFVMVWLSFAVVLFYINEVNHNTAIDRLPRLRPSDVVLLMISGLLGGGLSAIVGSGLDIVTFSVVTMRFGLSEKTATPTSVVLMASNSVIGFFLHTIILRDFGPQAYSYWLTCIPVVLIGAPLGAWFVSQQGRKFIVRFLYVIIVVQFIGACFVVRPQGQLLYFSCASFAFGLVFFFALAAKRTKAV